LVLGLGFAFRFLV